MLRMRHRMITLGLCTVALSLTAVAPASAAFTANGGVTALTSTAATLNGSFQVSFPDSGWAFQYGTSTAYGHLTTAQVVQPGGVQVVSARVTNLRPGTTYHFRLVVYQDTTTESRYSVSEDRSFTTPTASSKPPGKKSPGHGTAGLRSRSLLVSKGRVAVPLHCSGKTGAKCKGSLTLRVRGKHGSIRCGGTSFSLRAGTTRTLHPGVRRSCVALLIAAPRHQISATLRATFSTHQASLTQPVTLHQ